MWLSYFFDCFDGHFARTYNMVTTFGDYYDHISDTSKIILLLYFIYINYTSKFFIILPIILVSLLFTLIHMSCQELYYGGYADTLSLLKYFCITDKKNVNSVLKITKYFGCGTFYLVMILCIIYLKNSKKDKKDEKDKKI